MAIVIGILACVLAAVLSVWHFFLTPPSNLPTNIPTIPFWVSLIPFFKDVDQKETFRTYLQEPLAKYGAVKYFFGARWNILIVRPEFVAEMFKYEDIYQKSGNQKKIPYSVLAEYTGDNIISSFGENWRLYQSILKPGLQAKFDIEPIMRNAHRVIDLIEKEQTRGGKNGVLVPPLLQRYTLANLSEILMSTDFKTLDRPDAPLHTMQLAVKREIFKPIFLSFPFLDLFPVPSRNHARKLVKAFGDELVRTVRHVRAPAVSGNHTTEEKSADPLPTKPLDLVNPLSPGERLLAAHDAGDITPMQLRHNLISVFLAGHENPQLLLVSAMYLLAKHPEWQSKLRDEVRSTGLEVPTHAILDNLPVLSAVVYETLRMLPPISQLINRRTSETAVLQASDNSGAGPIVIPQGTYVGYNAYATQHLMHASAVPGEKATNPTDNSTSFKSSWGDDPDVFRPSRWGGDIEEIHKRYRNASRKGEFIAFHGGRRACLGEKFGTLEGKVTLWELVRTGEWSLSNTWPDRMTPAGPLYPRLMRLSWGSFNKEGETTT